MDLRFACKQADTMAAAQLFENEQEIHSENNVYDNVGLAQKQKIRYVKQNADWASKNHT